MKTRTTQKVPAAPEFAGGLGVAVAAFVVVWAVFVWPWLSGAMTIPWDGKAHFAPQVQFMAASFGRGEWPWWTPNVFAGHPQIADPQSMIFSPPFFVLALFDKAPGPWAIDSVVLVMLLAAGLGVLWLTDDLGWHWIGGFIAAVCFAFGAAMAWRMQHFGQVLSLAYLPFAMLFLRLAIGKGSLVAGAGAGLFAAFILLGRDQVGLLAIYLLSAYALMLLASGKSIAANVRRAVLPLGMGAVVGVALVAIPILLTVALAGQSNRPAIAFMDAAAGSLHPALLITGLVPHLFGAAGEMRDYWGPPSFAWADTGLFLAQNMGQVYLGALPLLLITIGAVRGMLWQPGIRFFTIAWLLALLYALGWYTPMFRVFHEVLPGVSFYRRPADAVFLIGGLGAFLAGYVVHRMVSEAREGRPLGAVAMAAVAGCMALLFAIAVSFAVMFGKLESADVPLLKALLWVSLAVGALGLAMWLIPIRPVLAGLIVVAVASVDIIVNNGPNGASALPTETLAILEPDGRDTTIAKLKQLTTATETDTRRDRIELVGLGYHWPNTPLTHDLHATLGANPVRLSHYVAATGAGDTVAEGGQRAFPPLFPSYDSTLANLLGLRFIATGDPIEEIDPSLRSGRLKLVARTPKAYIYENPRARPRVLFATEARTVEFSDIVRTGVWPDVSFDGVVLLEQGVSSERGKRRPGEIAIQSYRNTVVELRVSSPDGGWAVLNDVWHPWWRAEVDGRRAPILKANVLFRAVQVPPGAHTVRFTFHPLAGAWAELTGKRSRTTGPKSDNPQPSQNLHSSMTLPTR